MTRLKKLISWTALAVTLGLITPGVWAAELDVAATLPSLADLVRQVGGDRVKVHGICKGYEDPHYLQAKPSYARSLRKVDLLVYSGLDLEVGWLPPLLETARNPKLAPGSTGLLEASAAVKHILEVPQGDVSRAQGDIHPFGNPHFMLDPRNGLAVAELIADRLTTLDPEGADTYRANLEAYRTRLQQEIDQWDGLLAPYKGTPVVAFHKQWEYLVDWSGITMIDYIEDKPGIPPSPRHVEALAQHMKDAGVKLVIAATFTDEDASEEMAQRGGAKFLLLPAEVGGVEGTDTYIDLIGYIVNQIVDGLPKS